MADYERSTTVRMPADDLFEFLSRVENLPRHLSRMTGARSVTGDEVEVEARIDPSGDDAPEEERTVRGEAWFRIDADRRTLARGAQGAPRPPRRARGAPPGALDTDVRVRLPTVHDDAEAIQEGLAETLTNIEHLATS